MRGTISSSKPIHGTSTVAPLCVPSPLLVSDCLSDSNPTYESETLFQCTRSRLSGLLSAIEEREKGGGNQRLSIDEWRDELSQEGLSPFPSPPSSALLFMMNRRHSESLPLDTIDCLRDLRNESGLRVSQTSLLLEQFSAHYLSL
jgi:hypothetical protein